jgi:cbb3-type cytochrome oxidase subunit 1
MQVMWSYPNIGINERPKGNDGKTITPNWSAKIRPIYVSNWFYGALIIVVAMLHIVNNLAIPYSWFFWGTF